jgi:hypothetical protein
MQNRPRRRARSPRRIAIYRYQSLISFTSVLSTSRQAPHIWRWLLLYLILNPVRLLLFCFAVLPPEIVYTRVRMSS